MDLLDRLRLEHPVVQAGMGGGTAGAELAGAVSSAGGLGTVGILLSPRAMHQEVVRARALAGEGRRARAGQGPPLAANLLVPFAREAHAQACVDAGVDCVVLFCGFAPKLVRKLREAGVLVLHQVGTVPQAKRALAEGADGLVAQGREAGGHLLGVEPALDFLSRLLEIARGRPVLIAGGIADAQDLRRALDAGAAAAVSGTRFLLTDECAAHPVYKQRVLEADETVETLLFSVGWHERHRVVPNAATRRWCRPGPQGASQTAEPAGAGGQAGAERGAVAPGPRPILALNRALAPLLRRLPPSASMATLARQSVSVPLYGPASILRGMDERLVDVTPLYAGETATRIGGVVPAAEAVRQLAP